MKKLIIIFFFIINLCSPAEAKYTQTCSVKYLTKEGWSKKYTVDVTFVSGSELNEATSSYKYSSYSVYAIIFWGDRQATVIKIATYLSCGEEVDKNCITGSYGDHKGKDQDGDEWKICTGDFCY
jgi:hypothetical protein